MADLEIIPFAPIGHREYPTWIRALRKSNGVYVIREISSGEIAYIGESHSHRLYATLTRHFQRWSPKFETAGPTYARRDVDVAVVITPQDHATYLQDQLICALAPRDNRTTCTDLMEREEEPPEGYRHTLRAVISALYHGEHSPLDDVPF